MIGQIFEYIILLNPTQAEIKEGKVATVVQDLKRMVAANEAAVTMTASRELSEENAKLIDRIEVAVRTF